ncbi:hypothetical protein Tco_1250212, partial [Tanacetum coccineum]
DPPKGTLVPRVQLATVADEVVAKRCGYRSVAKEHVSHKLGNESLARRRTLAVVFLVAIVLQNHKEKKNKTLMRRVPKVGTPRRHVRDDKLIVIFQLAGMLLCSRLRDDVCITELRSKCPNS